MKNVREIYKRINYSGGKQRLGDGGSILGRGVVSFFISDPEGGPQEISFETVAQGLCDED